MALMSTSRPIDKSLGSLIAGEAVSVLAKDKVSKEVNTRIKAKKHGRISDTSGNFTAGGPGSGRKAEVEKHLASKGFTKMKTPGGNPSGMSFWHKTVSHDSDEQRESTNASHHMVAVDPDGSWTHSIEGLHEGKSTEALQHSLRMAAGSFINCISGNTVQSLNRILARSFSDKKRKSLAKKKKALPDGSFPIANKQDLANAKRAVGRSKNPAKARAFINKRAKELNAPKIGASKVKALGEDNLDNNKINNYMKQQSASVTVRASNGSIRVTAGGPGSGKHITVTTSDKGERNNVHKVLLEKGFTKSKNDRNSKDKNTPKTYNYQHKNGDKVTMRYNPSVDAGGEGSGRKVGMALGKMLRKELVKRMSKAIQIADKKSVTAGGPGSGRQPSFQQDSPDHAKLNSLHKNLRERGFNYKSSSQVDKGIIHHT